MKKLLLFLIIEAIALVGLSLLGTIITGGALRFLTFPFEKLGELLRYMSLSGDGGNALAIALYVIVGLVPVVLLLVKVIKKKFRVEDLLLVVISAAYYLMTYIMINPKTVLGGYGSDETLVMAKIVICAAMYSTILSYAAAKIIRKVSVKKQNKGVLKSYLIAGLTIMAGFIVYDVCYESLNEFIGKINGLDSNFYEVRSYKILDTLILSMRYVTEIVPSIGNIVIISAVAILLKKVDKEAVLVSMVEDIRRIAIICRVSIICTIVVNVIYDMLLLIVAGKISHLLVDINFPIVSLMITIMVLLLANCINDYKSIKEENDMFI